MKKVKVTIELEFEERSPCEDVYILALEKFEEALVKQKVLCPLCCSRSSLVSFILSFIISKVYQNEKLHKEEIPDIKSHNLRFLMSAIFASLVSETKEIFQERWKQFTEEGQIKSFDNSDMIVFYLPVTKEQLVTDSYHRVSYAAEQLLPPELKNFRHIFVAYQAILLMWEQFEDDDGKRREETYKLIENFGRFSNIKTNREFENFLHENFKELKESLSCQ